MYHMLGGLRVRLALDRAASLLIRGDDGASG
jgi:hypothetical protein